MFPLIHSAAGTAGADDKHLAGCNADVPSFRVVVVSDGGLLGPRPPRKQALGRDVYVIIVGWVNLPGQVEYGPAQEPGERVQLHRSNFTDRLTSGSLSVDRQVRSLQYSFSAPGSSGYQSFRSVMYVAVGDENHDIRGGREKKKRACEAQSSRVVEGPATRVQRGIRGGSCRVEMKIGSTAHHV